LAWKTLRILTKVALESIPGVSARPRTEHKTEKDG
jgi:hypothetical protein